MASEKIVIGLAGMPGSGKSVVANVAKRRGYDVVLMGNIVREEAQRRHVEPSPEELGKIMLELRRVEGDAAIAKRCITRIESAHRSRVLIDGLRSLAEVEEFKKHFAKFALVAIHTSPEARFKRLFARHRSDDPKVMETFRERDRRELSVGLGNTIAMADHIIVNEGNIEATKTRARQVLMRVERKWTR
jgi:dephospho-CoA kinase